MRQVHQLLQQTVMRDQLSCVLIGNQLVGQGSESARVGFWEMLRRRAKLLLAATEVIRKVEVSAFYDQGFIEELLNERMALGKVQLDPRRPTGARLLPFLGHLCAKLRPASSSESTLFRRLTEFRRQFDACDPDEVLAFLEQESDYLLRSL
jgi:hypothetical protein